MGKVKSGVLGQVSGSVGPVVFAVVNGQQTVRDKPKKSTRPPTQNQMDVRDIFKLASDVMMDFSDMINVGFKIHTKFSTPMNTAVKYHIENAITGPSPDFEMDFTKVVLSNGKRDVVNNMDVKAAASGAMMNITWDPYEDTDTDLQTLRNEDLAYFAFYHIAQGRYVASKGLVKRGAGEWDVKIPNSLAGGLMHAWVFFVTADGKKSFKSEYLGTHTAVI